MKEPVKKKRKPKKRTEKDKDALNLKQELFCKLYATETEFFGNGVRAYVEAYKPNQRVTNWYKTACVDASQLLRNPKVCKRIAEMLTLEGFNDEFMDKQLLYVATQHDDVPSKVRAISEYNKLKKRISTKLELEIPVDKEIKDQANKVLMNYLNGLTKDSTGE